MGIKGLWKTVGPYVRESHISVFKQKVIGIDMYVWIHKAVVGAVAFREEAIIDIFERKYKDAGDECSEVDFTVDDLSFTAEDVIEIKDKLFEDITKKLETLQRYGIIPYCVFDGREMPIKQGTDEARGERRQERLLSAFRSLNTLYHMTCGSRGGATGSKGHNWLLRDSHLYKEALSSLEKSLDITTELAHTLFLFLRDYKHVHCLVSPYEADAQLAFLCRNGTVHGVISEDSDLILYFCPIVIAKLDFFSGRCEVIDPPNAIPTFYRDLYRKNNNSSGGSSGDVNTTSSSNNSNTVSGSGGVFSYESFVLACVMSGCDYLPNLSGVGIMKAFKLVQQSTSLPHLLRLLEENYGFPHDYLTGEYRRGLLHAFYCFAHHIVYDPSKRECCHYHPLPPASEDGRGMDYRPELLGERLSGSDAYAVCEAGTHDPTTLALYTGRYSHVLQRYLDRVGGGRRDRRLTSFAGFSGFSAPKIVIYPEEVNGASAGPASNSGSGIGCKRARAEDHSDNIDGNDNDDITFFSKPLEKVKQCGALLSTNADSKSIRQLVSSKRIIRSKFFVNKCVTLDDSFDWSGNEEEEEADATVSTASSTQSTLTGNINVRNGTHNHTNNGLLDTVPSTYHSSSSPNTTMRSSLSGFANAALSKTQLDGSDDNSGTPTDAMISTAHSGSTSDDTDISNVAIIREAVKAESPFDLFQYNKNPTKYTDIYCQNGKNNLRNFTFKPPRRTDSQTYSCDEGSNLTATADIKSANNNDNDTDSVEITSSSEVAISPKSVNTDNGKTTRKKTSTGDSVDSLNLLFSQLSYKR